MAGQSWDAGRYAASAGFVADLGQSLVDELAPTPGERILDLGCGDGRLSAAIAARGARVVGVDSAPDMLAAAQGRGVDARFADGVALPFDREFDAVFSNAALHWMLDPDDVLAGVHRALRPGGRFVGEMGGHGNVAAIQTALRAVLSARGHATNGALPWYFPTAAGYRRRLARQGFQVDSIVLFPRPTPLTTEIGAWLDIFANGVLGRFPRPERDSARNDVIDLLRPALCDDEGTWTADYVRLRFSAIRAA